MHLHLSTKWVAHLMFKCRKMIIWSVSSTGQVCFLPLPPNKEHESHCIYSNIMGFSSKALWKKKAPICLLLDSILKLMLHDGADPFRQSQNSWKVTGKRSLKGVNITFSSRACLTGWHCQIPPQPFLRQRKPCYHQCQTQIGIETSAQTAVSLLYWTIVPSFP